jgi:effector-binding domain-containing protein
LTSLFACGIIRDDELDYFDESIESDEDYSDFSTDPDMASLVEKYPFLKSRYTVSATRESADKLYVYNYYFVRGVVSGATLVTSFSTVADAKKYFKITKDEFPDAKLDGASVVHYIGKDNLNHSGYTLEKLKFVLKKTGYEVKINFSEDYFNERYNVSKDKNDGN